MLLQFSYLLVVPCIVYVVFLDYAVFVAELSLFLWSVRVATELIGAASVRITYLFFPVFLSLSLIFLSCFERIWFSLISLLYSCLLSDSDWCSKYRPYRYIKNCKNVSKPAYLSKAITANFSSAKMAISLQSDVVLLNASIFQISLVDGMVWRRWREFLNWRIVTVMALEVP